MSSAVRILGLDPGQKAGSSIIDVYPDGETKLIFSETIYSEKLIRRYPEKEFELGASAAKLWAISKQIKKVIAFYKPNYVASEVPFMRARNVSAYKSLTECVLTFQNAVTDSEYTHHSMIRLEPSVIKKAVGVKGNSGDKEDMLIALRKQPQFDACGIDIESLDDNAIDSICIALAAKKILF